MFSHGRPKRQVETADGQYLRVDNLPLIFSAQHCPKMADKPKLFFINACDGTSKNKAVAAASDGHHVEEGTVTLEVDGCQETPDGAAAAASTSDYLIAYATTPYSPAYRDRIKGCYFVDDFCRAANAQWERKDLEEILRGLRRDAEPIPAGTEQGKAMYQYQIPVSQTALTRKYWLRKKRA